MEENQLLCIIVEDEPLAQQILENYILRIHNLKLISKCESIEEAYAILTSDKIDIIFLDINLQRSSGMELIKELSLPSKVRYYIIITSAISSENIDLKDTFNTNSVMIMDHLTKPFSFERFSEAIKKVIEVHNSLIH